MKGVGTRKRRKRIEEKQKKTVGRKRVRGKRVRSKEEEGTENKTEPEDV
jgi:hypothetical protein